MEAGIHQLTAGYALDALDPEQRREYEAHLSTCAHCQDELASFWETTEALAVAASGPEPSPELRERILAEVRTEPPQVVVPFEPRRRRAVPVLAAAAGSRPSSRSGSGSGHRICRASSTRHALRSIRRAAAQVLVDPGARSVSLQAGEGRLVVNQQGEAVLVLHGVDPLPPARPTRCGSCRVETSHRRIARGSSPGVGSEIERLDGTVGVGDVVAVTIETAGGVDAPTTAPIIASDPV